MKISFEFEGNVEAIEALKDKAKIETMEEFFNISLTLFSHIVDEIVAGNEIGTIDHKNETYRTIEMDWIKKLSAVGANVVKE
jgi:hypothetical protein